MRRFFTQPNRQRVWTIAASLGLLVMSLPTAATALELPLLKRFQGGGCVTVAGLQWHTDYADACCEAQCARRMLLVNFVPDDDRDAQRRLERYIARDARLRAKLKKYVLLRVPHDAEIGHFRNRRRLIDDPAFQHLGREPGIAIVDYRHSREPYYGRVVTALPLSDGKYYRWQNSHLAVALDLPPGTITQRTMVWAVRVHPEAPASTTGQQDPALVQAAAEHSADQARRGVQGHDGFEVRYQHVCATTGAGTASEVVAESWPDQNLIDSCLDCVNSWRHSPGHWSAVQAPQRLYAYDIHHGRNGIWYGTGIFAN